MQRVLFSALRILPLTAFAPVFDGSDAGDGGAGGSGNGSGNPGGGGQPAGLTEEAAKQVNELINKALGPRFKALEEKQAKSLEAFGTGLTEKLFGGLDERLSALKPAEPAGGKPKGDAELSQNPEFRALKKQHDDLQKQLEKEREEKKAASAKARNEALHSLVQSELGSLGIADPKSVRTLLQSYGLVGYESDDSDSVVFKDEDGGALPLKKGLESWVKTSPLAKRFMAATGADGSGEHRGERGTQSLGTQSNGAAKPSRASLGNALLRLGQGG